MLKETVVYLNIMSPRGREKDVVSYYELLIGAMHSLGCHTDLGFIPQIAKFGLTPLPNENAKEKEILIAAKAFINFWIEYRYLGYDQLVDNLEYLDSVAWNISSDLMQFRFTARRKIGQLPKEFFYVLDKKVMSENFVKKS